MIIVIRTSLNNPLFFWSNETQSSVLFPGKKYAKLSRYKSMSN